MIADIDWGFVFKALLRLFIGSIGAIAQIVEPAWRLIVVVLGIILLILGIKSLRK